MFSIIFVSVGVIAYPLFWTKSQKYTINYSSTEKLTQKSFWLSALSDLEDDFTLGRINKDDFQKQKLILQRRYLESIKITTNAID